jgi:hypothetical protein
MLTGTEKQVKYAEEVRDYVLFQLSIIDEAGPLVEAIKKIKKAEIILNAFADMKKCKNVKTKTLEFLKWEKKERYTQKDVMSIKDRGITIKEVPDDEFVVYKKDIKEEITNSDLRNVATAKFKPITEKQINYINELISKYYRNKEYLKLIILKNKMSMQMIDNMMNLSSSSASQLIKVLLKGIPKASGSAPRYFVSKYDTYDCETGEKISAGELVWKDEDGIHRADNW